MWWRVKKWAVKLFDRLATQWGQPELVEEAPVKALAITFNKVVAPAACSALVGELHGHMGTAADAVGVRKYMSRKVLFYGLHLLQSCLDFASAWKAVLKAELEFLLGVAFEQFRMTAAELETIEHDPYEYMRINATDAFDTSSPRASARLLFWAALEVRKAATAPVLTNMLATGLAACPPGGGDPLYKEALLYLVQELHEWLATDKVQKGRLEGLLEGHVTPEFASPHAFLRARAIAVWARYCDIRFRRKDLLMTAVRHVYDCLSDPALVVKLTAGSSLGAFLARSKSARKAMEPAVMDILKALFRMLDDLGTDEVVRTVGVMCEAYYKLLPHIARDLLSQLVKLWVESLPAPDANPLDIDDENALLGDGLLSTVQVILFQLMQSDHCDVIVANTDIMFELIASLFQKEGPTLEYVDSGFDIFSDMLVAMEGRVAEMGAMWDLYARMIDFYSTSAADCTEIMLTPVDCLCAYAPDRFTAEKDPTTGLDNVHLLLHAMRTAEEKGDDHERGWMIRMWLTVLHNCRGKVDRALPDLLATYAPLAATSHLVR